MKYQAFEIVLGTLFQKRDWVQNVSNCSREFAAVWLTPKSF